MTVIIPFLFLSEVNIWRIVLNLCIWHIAEKIVLKRNRENHIVFRLTYNLRSMQIETSLK